MFIKILILTSSCASDGWYVQRERAIRLTPEERERGRENGVKKNINYMVIVGHQYTKNQPQKNWKG